MAKPNTEKWQQAARQTLERLDLRAEFAALGVEITGGEPNANGWLECRAFGKQDVNPSAGINLSGEHPHRGRYKEFVGDGANLSLFELAVAAGKFSTWQEARDHYASAAGVALPKSKPPRHPNDSLELRDYNAAIVTSWCSKKPGIIEPAVKLCGGQLANESRKHTVVALPVYGEFGADDSPCGWVCWNVTGKPLSVFAGKGLPPRQAKMKTVSGSKSGWMGRDGLARLQSVETVWVTEGPTDLLGLVTAILQEAPESLGQHAVICNSGGANELPQPDLLAPLAGKRVIVVPDCDVPGQTGCRRRAQAIAEIAREVRFVRLPFEITDSHGKDLRDYLTGDGSFSELVALARVSELIRATPEPLPSISDVTPEQAKAAVASADTGTIYERELLDSIGIDVLGEMDGGKIKVFSEYHRKTDILSEIGKLTYHRLMQVAGPAIKSKVHAGNEMIPDMHTFTSVKEAIALLAGYRRIEQSEAGIGCWQGLDEEGQQTHAIVLVGAGEAAVRNGRPGLIKVSRPRYGGRLLDISSSEPWYEFDSLSADTAQCDQPWAAEVVSELEALLARWRWLQHGQSPKIVAGLILATWVQTIWQWRPQVSISGKSNAGKSTLFKCLAGLFGNLAITSSGSTAAGIRQAISRSAAIVLLDEFESGRHRTEILEMLRASGRGDKVLRGTTNHRGQEFTLRHIVWTAGIESGLKREPDKNRFVRLELIKPQSKEMGKLNLPGEQELNRLGQRLLAIALRFAFAWQELAQSLRVLKYEGVNERLVECYSVPAACYSVCMGPEAGQPSEVLGRMLTAIGSTAEGMDDERQLLQDILASEVDLGKGERATVGQVIQRRDLDPMRLDDLERKGVAVVAHGDGKALFVSHRSVCRGLLRGTDWESQNIDEILLRIPGALKTKKRIAGSHPWGVVLPLSITEQDDQQ